MNNSFYIGPHFMLTFSYVMHAVTKQSCILPAERNRPTEGVRHSHRNWVQQSSNGSERSQRLEGEDGIGG